MRASRTANGSTRPENRPARTPGPLGLSLRSGLLGLTLVGVPAMAIGAGVAGVGGTVSAGAAVAVILFFFLISLTLVEGVSRKAPPLMMLVALMSYTGLLIALGVLLFASSLPQKLHPSVFGFTVLGGTLGWVMAQSVAVWRMRTPYVQVESSTHPSHGGSDDG